MTNYREILRLTSLGLNRTQIADSLGASRTTTIHTLQRAAAQELDWQTVRYIRLPDLLSELAIARAEGTYRKIMKQLKQTKLLILDEWLLYQLKEIEAKDLLEIAEARYKKASTIFCSQHDVGDWHDKIGESTIADAVLDRIVHNSYRIIIKSDHEDSVSMRQRKGLSEQ